MAISSSRITDRSAGPRLSSWLTMISVAPASAASANSRSRKASWRSRSSAEVGSSATISSGAPISARAAATRCCWPTLRLAAERPRVRLALEAKARAAAARASSSADALARRPLAAPGREAQRQHHVVEDRAVGQQVEHLEDDAEVLGAEASRADADSLVMSVPSISMRPACGATMPHKQAEEGRLAAAGRPDQQHALARGQGEVVDRPARRRRGPARRSARPTWR